jgi:hypothetical protein
MLGESSSEDRNFSKDGLGCFRSCDCRRRRRYPDTC